MTRTTLKTIALGALATASALATLIPVAASAQGYPQGSYDPRGGYYYNGCQRSQANRSVGGGLAGAAAGAVIGGNVASRHVRDEGALLGGALGALIGSQIGKSTAACSTQGQPQQSQQAYGYDNNGYYPGAYPQQQPYAQPYDYGYQQAPPPPQPRRSRGYAYGYGDDRARDYDYGYDTQSSDPNDCRMVESAVRMPDGRRQTRMVQACRDSHGDYQLVQ